MDIDKLNRLEKHCEDTLKMRVSQSIKDEHAFTLELIHGFKSLQLELTKVKKERDRLERWFEIHKNCENCRHEFDDKNSPCELCKDYLAWESNFGEMGE